MKHVSFIHRVWGFARKQSEETDSHRPQICSVVILPREHFWSHVRKSATHRSQLLFAAAPAVTATVLVTATSVGTAATILVVQCQFCAQSKVDEHECVLQRKRDPWGTPVHALSFPEDPIRWLDITVNNAFAMAVGSRTKHLPCETLSTRLIERRHSTFWLFNCSWHLVTRNGTQLIHTLKKLPTFAELQNKVDCCPYCSVERTIKQLKTAVRRLQQLHNAHFSCQRACIKHPSQINGFDRDTSASVFV
jgi:hypothetical protein